MHGSCVNLSQSFVNRHGWSRFNYQQALIPAGLWAIARLFIMYFLLSLGTMEFMGHADLPQQAKHNASVQALPYLNQMPDIKPPSKAAAIPKNSQSKKETETASMTKEGKNVIMVLNEIAMQQQVCIDWNIVDEDGPPHMRAFTYTLKMGSYEVSF